MKNCKKKICTVCGKKHTTTYKDYCLACYSRKRYAENDDYRKKHLIATINWQKAHPERNREIVNKAVKAWNERNKEKLKEINHKKYLCRKKNQ